MIEIELHIAITNQPEKAENIAIENNIRKVTRNSKIFNNMYKDRTIDYLVMLSSRKA